MPHDLISEPGAKPIKAWIHGVPLEDAARAQLLKTARLPFIHQHIALHAPGLPTGQEQPH